MNPTLHSTEFGSGRNGVLDRVLARIGIRPEEQRLTLLLFTNIFLCGITQCTIRVCAYTLFLSQFESDQLAFIAVALAITGTLVTVVINRVTARWSVRGYVNTVLAVILVGLVAFRSLLSVSESKWLIFLLPLWFELAYMLFSLQFVTLLARLLDVRQTKRLAGLIRSGEFVAEMIAGVSIAALLSFIHVADLLVVAGIAALGVVIVVQFTIWSFRTRLLSTADAAATEEPRGGQIGALLKQRYVRFICLCESAYIFAYFFLDVAFYDYTSAQLPVQHELAAFLGDFFAVVAATTLFVMVFLFGAVLRKFGVFAGIIAFPLLVGLGSAAVFSMELVSAPLAIIFSVIVITNGARFISQSSLWRPTIAVLLQALPDRLRAHGSALIEGIVDPLASGAAGVCLYLVTALLGWGPDRFLILLALVMCAWMASGFVIRRQYVSRLVRALRKRKLGELVLTELDAATLAVIKRGIESVYPAEIFYCLNLLEEFAPREVAGHLSTLIDHSVPQVRLDAAQRIEQLHLAEQGSLIIERISREPDPKVLGQMLRTCGSLGLDGAEQILRSRLEDEHALVRKGALTGLLRYDPENPSARDRLAALVRSTESNDRTLAAELLGDSGELAFSAYLAELIMDSDPGIAGAAIVAAGKLRDPHLVKLVITKLAAPALHSSVNFALQRYGVTAVSDLAEYFSSRNRSRHEKLHIIEICRGIGGPEVIDLYVRLLDSESFEVRYSLLVNLANLGYQAPAESHYVYWNLLNEEIDLIAWLLSTMDDLYEETDYRAVHDALGSELDLRRDVVMLLLSFIFPSAVILDARVNLLSKVAELRTFALEVLDNTLSNEIKEIVMPLLDNLNVKERLALLERRFPQVKRAPFERMDELIHDHYRSASYWTRAVVVHQMGESGRTDHFPLLREALSDAEPIVRETALWSMKQTRAPALQGWVYSLQRDPDRAVRQLAQELRAEL